MPLDPSLDPLLEPLSYDYTIFTVHINPKLLKQITKDLLEDKLFKKIYG
jgi:hypothetical protein